LLAASLVLSGGAAAHEAAPLPKLDFVPPAAGSYELHRIMPAPEGEVLGVDGKPRRLSEFTRERVTLLGFIYTACADPDGCPLANRVFDELHASISAAPSMRGKVRLVTLSFDPARDLPAVMREFAGSRVKNGKGPAPWYFLTTRSARELAPLVDGFGQDVQGSGKELSHVTKVFLIDGAGDVREIYTNTFLHPRTVLNDIETLLMEGRKQ